MLPKNQVRFLALFLTILSGAASADWIELRSGPFHVLSEESDKRARETLNFAEQLRYALGANLGQPDLQPPFPVRILVSNQRAAAYPEPKLARDAYLMGVAEMDAPAAAALTKLLLDSAPGHIPPHLERGLISLYATLLVDGTRVTLGTPPPQKHRDWTRAHMLAVHPDYSGKLRVLLGNLGRGIDPEVAYRNAFGMTAEDIEKAVDRYMEAGQYGVVAAPSRPINPNRDLRVRDAEAIAGTIASADLLLAHGRQEARGAYEAILKTDASRVEAHEGLGLVLLREGQRERAREHFVKAASPRALFELARLDKDRVTAARAAEANPKWSEPQKLLASLEPHPAQKLAALRKAAQLEPRSTANWQALAIAQEENKQFVDAAKSWGAAERATDDPNERERLRQTRLAGEEKRRQAEIAAREEARRKTEQEMNDLRNKALLEIRTAEARANAGKPVIDPSTLEEYKEGPGTTKISGVLTRVDCMGPQARLHVSAGRQVLRLIVPDPGKISIAGGGERNFICGPQKPARPVTIEYMPKPEPKQGTAGEAVTIDFK